MELSEKYGKTALIAGASEGIGSAFASLLAEEGMNLVLIARRPEPLQKFANALENKFKINGSNNQIGKKILKDISLMYNINFEFPANAEYATAIGAALSEL